MNAETISIRDISGVESSAQIQITNDVVYVRTWFKTFHFTRESVLSACKRLLELLEEK